MKFETARIHFLGDDLAAVAVVVNVLKSEMHLFTNPIESKYSGDVFEAVQNTQSTCFKH